MGKSSECDLVSMVGLLIVFALPLTLLIPEFSMWDVVPKVRVIRFHIFAQHLSWQQLNAALVTCLIVFFCLYLEIRKRKIDDMVESVLTVCQATDKAMEQERERHTATVRVCVELLDTSTEHYEHLVLLREELRQRKQQPPAIEPSGSSI